MFSAEEILQYLEGKEDDINPMLTFPATGYFNNNTFFGGNFMAFQPNNKLSIEAWVYYTGTSGFGLPGICERVFIPDQPSNLHGWGLSTVQIGSIERVDFQINAGNQRLIVQSLTTNSIRFNEPTQIIVSYKGDRNATNTKIYINGEPSTQVMINNLPTNNIAYTAFGLPSTFQIGRRRVATFPEVNGFNFQRPMGKLTLWDAALTDQDAAVLYNDGRGLDLESNFMYNDKIMGAWNFGRVWDFFGTGSHVLASAKYSRARDWNGAGGFMVAGNIDRTNNFPPREFISRFE